MAREKNKHRDNFALISIHYKNLRGLASRDRIILGRGSSLASLCTTLSVDYWKNAVFPIQRIIIIKTRCQLRFFILLYKKDKLLFFGGLTGFLRLIYLNI